PLHTVTRHTAFLPVLVKASEQDMEGAWLDMEEQISTVRPVRTLSRKEVGSRPKDFTLSLDEVRFLAAISRLKMALATRDSLDIQDAYAHVITSPLAQKVKQLKGPTASLKVHNLAALGLSGSLLRMLATGWIGGFIAGAKLVFWVRYKTSQI